VAKNEKGIIFLFSIFSTPTPNPPQFSTTGMRNNIVIALLPIGKF